MFHVTLSELIVIYLFLILGGLFVLWMFGEFIMTRRARRNRRHQLVCQVCNCHYEDRSDEPLPPCPQCGRTNERDPVSEI